MAHLVEIRKIPGFLTFMDDWLELGKSLSSSSCFCFSFCKGGSINVLFSSQILGTDPSVYSTVSRSVDGYLLTCWVWLNRGWIGRGGQLKRTCVWWIMYVNKRPGACQSPAFFAACLPSEWRSYPIKARVAVGHMLSTVPFNPFTSRQLLS